MRFSRIAITNYKGVARAELCDLGNQPVVTISRRNGTGKSCCSKRSSVNGLAATTCANAWALGPMSSVSS